VEIQRRERTQGGRRLLWNLAYGDAAAKEGRAILDDAQYTHVREQFELMAEFENPRSVQVLDVQPIDDFFELRDKGGILRKLNLRVYFGILEESRTIVVVGCYKKEEDSKLPVHVRLRMKNRLRIAKVKIGGGTS